MKVFSVETSYAHASVFRSRGHEVFNLNAYSGNVADYDLVLLVGGSDVNPELYGELPEPRTYSTPRQDDLVMEIINHCVEHDVPVVGICKGAQQLCVFDGGKLYQHVEGHEGEHPITVESTGEIIHTRGNHHQMMRPSDRASVLAYAENLSGHFLEPEVVHFPAISALGFQYHPEWMDGSSRGVSFFFELIEEYLVKE